MKYFYDTEFIDDGKTIELISIGIVREDGEEYYAVNQNCDPNRILAHDWLRANVLPSIPILYTPSGKVLWDGANPFLKAKSAIANEVKDFLKHSPELWAWYCAYDHVVLAQLWGPMSELPEGIPMYTYDLKQECMRLGNPKLPKFDGWVAHNALSDAHYARQVWKFLEAQEGVRMNEYLGLVANYPSLLRA